MNIHIDIYKYISIYIYIYIDVLSLMFKGIRLLFRFRLLYVGLTSCKLAQSLVRGRVCV